jgi:pentatricopeptide repeat protein
MMEAGISPNVATYNTIIRGLSDAGLIKEVDKWLSEMKSRGMRPDDFTYNALISGQAKIGNMKGSMTIYCEMIADGLVPKTSTYNVLISEFANVGKMLQARELLKEMGKRGVSPNTSTYCTMISGLCKLCTHPDVEWNKKAMYLAEAKGLLKEMVEEKGYIPCNQTIYWISAAFSKPGMKVDAERFLKECYKKKNARSSNS